MMDSLFGRQQSGEKALSRQASTESPKHSGHAPFTFKVSYGACTPPALRNSTRCLTYLSRRAGYS